MKRAELVLPDAPLILGSRGMAVDRLQVCLDTILKYKGKKKLQSMEPHYYGQATLEAVNRFQREHDIKEGFYDKTTRQRLREVIQCR